MVSQSNDNARAIGVITKDLLFGSQVNAAVVALGGYPVNLSKVIVESIKVRAILCNLDIPEMDFNQVIEVASQRSVPIFGYYPHVREDLREKGESSGVKAFPRGAFISQLPKLLSDLMK